MCWDLRLCQLLHVYIPIHTKKVWTCRTNRLIRTNRSIRLPGRSLETSLDQKQTRPEFVSRKKNSKLKKMSLVWNRSLDRVSIGKNYKPNVGAVWFGIFLVSVSIGLRGCPFGFFFTFKNPSFQVSNPWKPGFIGFEKHSSRVVSIRTRAQNQKSKFRTPKFQCYVVQWE